MRAGPLARIVLLEVDDAEEQQDDDQTDRHAEQPQQDWHPLYLLVRIPYLTKGIRSANDAKPPRPAG